MFDKILLALDGSPTSAAARPLAERVAATLQSEVIVLRVHDTKVRGEYPELGEAGDEGRVEAEAYVTSVANELAEAGVRATPVAVAGSAADAIVSFSEKAQPSLIAMATHGRTGLRRWALGSVAEKLLRTSHVPLLLVHAFSRGAEEGPITAPPRNIERIVVPIDGSERCLSVVPYVTAIAAAFGASVCVTHFVSDYGGKSAMPVAQSYLAEARTVFAAGDLHVEVDLRRGDPASGLADYGLIDAGRPAPDLIAMSTHGRSGLSRMLLGSVTEKVLRATTTPVLVIPPELA